MKMISATKLSVLLTLALVPILIGYSLVTKSEKFPDWLHGPILSERRDVSLHFLPDGVFWFKKNGDFKEISWRAEGGRYLVFQSVDGKRLDLGYVIRDNRDTIWWQQTVPREKPIKMFQVTREGDLVK